MTELFVALGILVLALLALLLWFVPHLLQQQATRVAGETSQLREMLLDLLNEQEAVTMRQTQLGSSLSQLRDQIEVVAKAGARTSGGDGVSSRELQQLEARFTELQFQIQNWIERRANGQVRQAVQDNESWAYLLSLLASIQERVSVLSQDRSNAVMGTHATELIMQLEQEMQNLRSISQDIEKMQWRLRHALHERENNGNNVRAPVNNGTNYARDGVVK